MSEINVNGVPVHACRTLIDAVSADPVAGQTAWRSHTVWKGGLQCESTIRQHTVHMDEPEGLGGTDTAPNMVEQVLAAYGSCLTVGYALNASLRGIAIRSLEIAVEGELDLAGFFGLSKAVSPGFSGIRASVHLDAEGTDDDLAALHAHVLETSPVGTILTRPVPVATSLRLEPVSEPSPAPRAA